MKQTAAAPAERERWSSRAGVILAAAGNAIGIGNLLRFPGQAAQHGGGTFLVAYFVALILLGIPMMWVAWTVGRLGGRHGHGSTPGMFERLWRHKAARYLGTLGLSLPLLFCLYYAYIEAWCLGYAWFSVTGDFADASRVDLATYLAEFQGAAPSHAYFGGVASAVGFFCVAVLLNAWVLMQGVSKGLERLALVAMPLLLVLCLLMAARVLSLPPGRGEALDGLAFLYTPDFTKLLGSEVWLAAAGQVFFTLSIGFGALECYASYLRDDDDVALTGLTTSATNEFVEVIFGSAIAIPACAVFFGASAISAIAASGTFNIGMVAMAEILRSTGGLAFFGTAWFLLLFFAAFTSSAATAQPIVAFLQDELKVPRPAAVGILTLVWLLGGVLVALLSPYGFLHELDFWAGTVGIVVFALVEVILFAWCFGIDRGWEELHLGARMKVPWAFRFVLRYVTPVLLVGVLAGWIARDVVAGDALTPHPAVQVAVLDRGDHPGLFTSGGAATDDARQAVSAGHDAVAQAVSATGRDLRLDIEAAYDPGGRSVRALAVRGDRELVAAISPDVASRWLTGMAWTYEVGGAPTPVQFQVAVRGLYTAPWVYLARFLVILVILGFLGLTKVAWRDRPALAKESSP